MLHVPKRTLPSKRAYCARQRLQAARQQESFSAFDLKSAALLLCTDLARHSKPCQPTHEVLPKTLDISHTAGCWLAISSYHRYTGCALNHPSSLLPRPLHGRSVQSLHAVYLRIILLTRWHSSAGYRTACVFPVQCKKLMLLQRPCKMAIISAMHMKNSLNQLFR